MSYSAVILPILAALSLAQEKLPIPTSSSWFATNPSQERLLADYYPKRHELKRLLPKELTCCVSEDTNIVNAFLKKQGYPLELEENGAQRELAFASILDIALTWKVLGTKSSLLIKGADSREHSYPAVSMKSGFIIRKTPKGKIIIALAAGNNDTVFMTLADASLEALGLIERIQSTLSSSPYEDVTHEYSAIKFPMVYMNHIVDINWLINLQFGTEKHLFYRLAKALQITRFTMNEKGARVESGAALDIWPKCAQEPKPLYSINAPFYLWIERPGMTLPLFAAYIDPIDWKEPLQS